MTDDERHLRILLVDDHRVVRAGLRMLLEAEPGLEVVDEAGDVRDAVFKTRRHAPDVIVLDVMLPDGDGDEAIGRLRAEAPETRVLILSMEDTGHPVRRAFADGANGDALHPAPGARMVQAQIEEQRRAAADPLSDREREVLRLPAEGHTNQEIAARPYISGHTAETHRAHIVDQGMLDRGS